MEDVPYICKASDQNVWKRDEKSNLQKSSIWPAMRMFDYY
jgi:hypothetical protein